MLSLVVMKDMRIAVLLEREKGWTGRGSKEDAYLQVIGAHADSVEVEGNCCQSMESDWKWDVGRSREAQT